MNKYIYYKHKVAGPFPEITEEIVTFWKGMVNGGLMRSLQDTGFLNEDVENHPDEVHIIEDRRDQHPESGPQ
jgi:hypothetical protein